LKTGLGGGGAPAEQFMAAGSFLALDLVLEGLDPRHIIVFFSFLDPPEVICMIL
jgi:hypothetical protein